MFKGEVMAKSDQPAAAIAAALAAPAPTPAADKPAPAGDKPKKPRARKAPAKSGAKNAATRKA